MRSTPKIYVDFNNRVKGLDDGEYYQVALSRLTGLGVGERVIASDYEEVEVRAEIAALLHAEGYGLIRVVAERAALVSATPSSDDRQIEAAFRAEIAAAA